MFKRILAVIITFCICFILVPEVKAANELNVSAKSAVLMDAQTGRIIYSKNPEEKLPMASTTKIMTALLAIESGRLDETVTVSANAQAQEGSSIYLRSGERILLRDLVYGLMLNSGNDAAVAIAEHMSGSEEAFAEAMTKRAKELGAVNTSFKNPNGLDQEGHYTTAYDLALIAAYAMKNDEFKKTVSTKSATATLEGGETLYFSNHNKLLKMYDGAVGVKTGFTKASGRCLVSAAERDGKMITAVTLNAPDDWNDHKKLLDYGFSAVEIKTLARKEERIAEKDGYGFVPEEDVQVVTGKDRFEIKLHLPKKLPSPANKGEKVGEGEVFYNGRSIKEFNIVAQEDITEEKKTSDSRRGMAGWIENFVEKIKRFLG